MENLSVDISYVSSLPLQGDSPKVTIRGSYVFDDFKVYFIDLDTDELIAVKKCKIDETVTGERQWYTRWGIQVLDYSDTPIFFEKIRLWQKKVFIKIDAYALGDNIAWMPYVEEFRKKHNCFVICSTFFNKLFEKQYPEIIFAPPNTHVTNIYAQYYIGAADELNLKYAPCISKNVPLQFVAAKSLGLKYEEVVPKVSLATYISRSEDKYICISEFGSSSTKQWKAPYGWQMVVDFLNALDYKVVVISKEPTMLKDVIDRTGNIDLQERINALKNAKLFIGVSSGLSWLSWAVGTHVVMISDVTPKFHEFQSNITRIGVNDLQTVDYNASKITTVKTVISELKKLL